MRKAFVVLLLAGLMMTAVPAFADLQNLTVGGEIRIRANYYSSGLFESPTGTAIRWPAFWLYKRPVGNTGAFNAPGILSSFRFDDSGNSLDFIEQRTRINFTADFTDDVRAFIELDSYDVWGEDFRSDYITGADFRASTRDDVEIYQAYIEANDMWGTPLRLRIGRQEMAYGSEWLVGTNDTNSFFTGLSFDGIRATYATDMFSVDAFWTILNEVGLAEEDGDVTFAGIYGSYLGLDDITIDAYWLWVRDPREIHDTEFTAIVEWIEDALSLDDYDTTNLHTFGLRGAGTIGAFDFETEVAGQWGDAGQIGTTFKPFIYGDDDADWDSSWGVNAEFGYTFDMSYQPRVYIGGAYFDGEDNRRISFLQWLSPFYHPTASVSFNRLFSNWEYGQFLDSTDLSNSIIGRFGGSVMPTESLEVRLDVLWFVADKEFRSPYYVTIGGFKVPVAPGLSFWTQDNADRMGWETDLAATYNYTEDLSFEIGWAHFFADSGTEEGNFISQNGLGFVGGIDEEDADYLWFETRLSF